MYGSGSVWCFQIPQNMFVLFSYFFHLTSNMSGAGISKRQLYSSNSIRAQVSVSKKPKSNKNHFYWTLSPFTSAVGPYWQRSEEVQKVYFYLTPIRVWANCNIFDLRSKSDLLHCTITIPLGTRGTHSIMLIIEVTLSRVERYNRLKQREVKARDVRDFSELLQQSHVEGNNRWRWTN